LLYFSVEYSPRSDVGLGLAANPNEYLVIAGARAMVDTQLQIAIVREVSEEPGGFTDAAEGTIVETPST
jgi:hypothetical protein